jgi:hypothetical protein
MLKACLVGAAITLALVAIPVVHWITALPSPFIGGYFAGSRAAATPGISLLIGGVMAALLVLPVGGILLGTSLLFGFGASFVLFGSAFYAVWCAMLGSLGAVVGGSSVRRQASES